MSRLFGLLWVVLCMMASVGWAQEMPDTVWQRLYSDQAWDYINTAVETRDSGFVLACATSAADHKPKHGHGGSDIWLVRTDQEGNILWQKNYGGSRDDRVVTVTRGVGGGYIFAGMTQSADGDIAAGKYHGGGDAWIVKVDDSGKIQWQQILGGSGFDCANMIITTPDSCYLMVGITSSKNGDLASNSGKSDVWMVKLNARGKILWSKTCGGAGEDWGMNAINATDGGFLVTCYTNSKNDVVNGYHGGGDLWLLHISNDGQLLWQKAFGGPGYDYASSIAATTDGGYVFCGTTQEVTHSANATKLQHFWVQKITHSGEPVWQSTFGGERFHIARTVHALDNGNFLVTGQGYVTDTETEQNTVSIDAALFCVSAQGGLLWHKYLGTPLNDSCNYSLITSDGSLVCTGSSYPMINGVPGTARAGWMFKTTPVEVLGVPGGELDAYRKVIQMFPNPTHGDVKVVLPRKLRNARIVVADNEGATLNVQIEGEGAERNFTLSAFAPGVYYVNVETPAGVIPFRIVLE